MPERPHDERRDDHRPWWRRVMSRRMSKVAGLLAPVVLVGSYIALSPSAAERTATPASFASVYADATAGDTITLATGNYGTWQGGSKAIVLKADSGATAIMGVNFTTGDQGLTLEGLRIPGGQILNGAKDITIRDSEFTASLSIDGVTNANILLDHDTFININASSRPGRLQLPYSQAAHSGVTVRNSLFQGGDSDGIQTGVGLNVIGNTFRDLCASGPNHTDNIQMVGSTGTVIRGNLVVSTSGCETQGIAAYDRLTRAVIEDNVVDILGRPWGIEIYSDNGSIVRHNTLRYRATCDYNIACGRIDVSRKTTDPAGVGTQIYDNITSAVGFANGSTASRNDHNVSGQNMVYVGPLTSWAGFALAPGSSGKGAASDGLDVGARFGAVPTPTATPTSTSTPSATPTASPTATATASATPTATASASPTATASPTPTPYDPTCRPGCDATISGLRAQIAAAQDALK